jgi:AcrR family transcriptional regulator
MVVLVDQEDPVPAATRDRIIEAATELFMRQGLTASGLKQVSAAAGAPIGSIYHFFPGGKEELAAETLRSSGAAYQRLVEAIFDASPDVVAGTRACFEGAAATLVASDYADACPVATVALEVATTDDELRAVAAGIFASWLQSAAARLEEGGIEPDRARDLGTVLVAALEGGFLLSRVAKSPAPMQAIGRVMTDLVEAAVGST